MHRRFPVRNVTRLAPLLILAWSIFVSWRRNARLLQEATRGKTSRRRRRLRANSRAPVFCACGSRAIGLLGKCTEIWAMNGWLPKVAEPLGSGRYLYDFHKMWETLSPLVRKFKEIYFLNLPLVHPSTIQCGCHKCVLPVLEDWHTEWGMEGGGWFFGGVWHPPVASSWTITFSDGEIVHLLHNFIFWGRFLNQRQR